MNGLVVGAVVRIEREHEFGSEYKLGGLYTVTQIDTSDETLRARSEDGVAQAAWLSWSCCKVVMGPIGWDFLKQHLTPATVTLLATFQGKEKLQLKMALAERVMYDEPLVEAQLRALGAVLQVQRPDDDDDTEAGPVEWADEDEWEHGMLSVPLDAEDMREIEAHNAAWENLTGVVAQPLPPGAGGDGA